MAEATAAATFPLLCSSPSFYNNTKKIKERIKQKQTMTRTRWIAISFSESSFPLTSGRKTRAPGATISGMRYRCRLRSETGLAGFGYFLCYFEMVGSQSLSFSDRWSRGTRLVGLKETYNGANDADGLQCG